MLGLVPCVCVCRLEHLRLVRTECPHGRPIVEPASWPLYEPPGGRQYSRHGGFEFGVGDDGERCWRAIEGSLRRADQIVSQNIDDGPGLAEAGIGLHERIQTYRQPENRATADPAAAGSEAALMRSPVEAAICALQ